MEALILSLSRKNIPVALRCVMFFFHTSEPLALKSFRHLYIVIYFNHENYNFLASKWLKNVLFSTNLLAKLLSDSLLLDSLISQSH